MKSTKTLIQNLIKTGDKPKYGGRLYFDGSLLSNGHWMVSIEHLPEKPSIKVFGETLDLSEPFSWGYFLPNRGAEAVLPNMARILEGATRESTVPATFSLVGSNLKLVQQDDGSVCYIIRTDNPSNLKKTLVCKAYLDAILALLGGSLDSLRVYMGQDPFDVVRFELDGHQFVIMPRRF